jgi:hypothetical protein
MGRFRVGALWSGPTRESIHLYILHLSIHTLRDDEHSLFDKSQEFLAENHEAFPTGARGVRLSESAVCGRAWNPLCVGVFVAKTRVLKSSPIQYSAAPWITTLMFAS